MASDDEDFSTGGLMDVPEDYYPTPRPPTMETFEMQSGKKINLHLVGESATEAQHLWNGGKFTADYFEKDPALVKDKSILELGAASGLPSLVAAILGARRVIMTDFPDADLIQNMQKNIDECDSTCQPAGSICKTISAVGFIWGGVPERLLSAGMPASSSQEDGKFDVLVLADLMFRHAEHPALVKTIKETMKKTADSKAFVFFTSYRPWLKDVDMGFFDVARDAGLEVEQVLEKMLDKPLFENDPGDLDVQKTVKGFIVRWPSEAFAATSTTS